MNNNLFNSVFEMELRIMVMLSSNKNMLFSKDKINALDFISLYGTQFGISERNINGDNYYKFAEIGSRRELIQEALNDLVIRGIVVPSFDDGFLYKLSHSGMRIVEKLESDYSREYLENAKKAVIQYGDMSEPELMRQIQKIAVKK